MAEALVDGPKVGLTLFQCFFIVRYEQKYLNGQRLGSFQTYGVSALKALFLTGVNTNLTT